MPDPTFWATIVGVALQIPPSIRALRDMAISGGIDDDTANKAYDEVAARLRGFGQAIKVLRAWKHAHTEVQSLRDSYETISRKLIEHEKDPVAFVAATVDEWASFRRNSISKVLSDFSADEVAIIGRISLGAGQNNVDWFSHLRNVRDLVERHRNNPQAVLKVYGALSRLDIFLKQLLTAIDRELREACGQFAEIWIRMEDVL